jgi:hypothetical protein
MGLLPTGPSRQQASSPHASHDHQHLEFVSKLEQAKFTRDEILEIEFSYNCAKNAHSGTFRQNGERYFEHVRAVANILIDARIALMTDGEEAIARKAVSKRTIIEALNHDTVEDTEIWGGGGRPAHERRAVVEWRLVHVHGVDPCKGILALSKVEVAENDPHISKDRAKRLTVTHIDTADPETQLVKLADRLHNVSTLDATSLGKQSRIVADTISNYRPIFERLDKRKDGFGLVATLLLTQLDSELREVSERLSQAATEDLKEHKKPKAEPEFDHVHADFLKKIRDKGFSSLDVELIDLAYDFGRFDRRLETNGSFGAARDMALELISKMEPEELDSRLVVAVLLQFSVEDGALFGSDFVPGLNYGRVAHLNLARIFGDQVSHMVTSCTPGEDLRLRTNQATISRYVSQVEKSGEQAVLITMLRAANTLEAGLVPGSEHNQDILERISAFYPTFERLASRDGNFSRLAILTLGKIKELYPQVNE